MGEEATAMGRQEQDRLELQERKHYWVALHLRGGGKKGESV